MNTSGDRDSELMETRLALAKIEGLLTATLARHDQRLDQHEGTLTQHGARLDDKGKTLARHDERLNDLEEDNQALRANVFSILGILLAGLSLARTFIAS